MRIPLLVGVALVALGATASAAPEEPTPGELRARVAELERLAAQVPSALEALHELENRLHALETGVARLSAQRAADPEVRAAVDDMRDELRELDRRLLGLDARLVREQHARSPIVWDDGLFLRAAPVEAHLAAGVQPRYRGVILPAPTGNLSGFDLHHAQLDLDGTVLGWLSVETRFDFGFEYLSQGALSAIRDLNVVARPLPWLYVRGGQFKVPYSRQRQVNALRQTFTDRSVATRVFAPDRDLGVAAGAQLFDGKLTIDAAVTDGVMAGRELANDNRDLAYTLRVVGAPLGPLPLTEGDRARTPRPRVAFGASFRYDLQPTDVPPPLDDLQHRGQRDNIELVDAGAEVAFRWRGFAVEGEYFFRQERRGFGRPNRQFHGGYGQASAMLWRGLEVGARVAYAQAPSLRPEPVGLFGDAPRSAFEAGGVVNYYVWNERVKAQLAYTFRDDAKSDPVDVRVHSGHVLEVQLQAGF